METQGREKKRVANIIWNAAEDYTLPPDFEVYDSRGQAALYWNYILGAVRKYFDYPQLQAFFRSLQGDPDRVFYESLAWIGLENCAFERAKFDRPVLDDLRRSYARQLLRGEDPPSFYYLIDEVKRARFQRVLGEDVVERDQVRVLLDELELSGSLTTTEIIERLQATIQAHFPLSPPLKKPRFTISLFPRRKKRDLGGGRPGLFRFPYKVTPMLSLFVQASEGPTDTGDYIKRRNPQQQVKRAWQNFQDQRTKKQRDYIQGYYGRSILSEPETLALEKVLCTENHRGCHLHFTRGEFDPHAVLRTVKVDPKKLAANQRERNQAHYHKYLARNNTSIERLTNAIRNALFVHLENATYRAKAGALVAGKVWRNLYLNDRKVFLRNVVDEFGNLSVDILLDASGSQVNRQELIATQGYIIAESLTRCHIPVKVYSFCTNSRFTIINLFRDYTETGKNEMIFNYRSTGCNRDGLAVRTALHLMQDSPSEHRILIVLSDGKPLDPQGIPTRGYHPDQSTYVDAVGVNDTAVEVRKGTRDGISVLGVFTGANEEIPDARKIYGTNLVCIHSPERFADMVGVLVQNVLKNL